MSNGAVDYWYQAARDAEGDYFTVPRLLLVELFRHWFAAEAHALEARRQRELPAVGQPRFTRQGW